MKKSIGLLLLILIGGCSKEEVPAKLDLNGTFVGTVVGKAPNTTFNGTATWVITHVGNEISAEITYQNVMGFNIPKYKGTIVNDTTLNGGFIEIPVQSFVNGKISKDGNHITCATASNDPSLSFIKVSFDLTRK